MLTQELLHELLKYDQRTGVFTWRSRNNGTKTWNARYAGTRAGHLNAQGYVRIAVFRQNYSAHRLAWLYVTGRWPSRDIDHANAIKSDNRFCNLREATAAQNIANCVLHKNNKSGVKGVCWCQQTSKWVAYITINKRRIRLGVFYDLDAARRARNEAAIKYYGEFARVTDTTPKHPLAICIPSNERVYKNNSSGARGVAFFPRGNKWRAKIQRNGRVHSLGYFDKFDEAVAARKNAEARLLVADQRAG